MPTRLNRGCTKKKLSSFPFRRGREKGGSNVWRGVEVFKEKRFRKAILGCWLLKGGCGTHADEVNNRGAEVLLHERSHRRGIFKKRRGKKL